MTLYTAPNISTGIDNALVDLTTEVPALVPVFLLFVFAIILISGSANQKRRTGTADYPFWCVLAGITILFLSLLMTIGEGIIDVTTLGVVVAVTILSGVWFFISKQRGEL